MGITRNISASIGTWTAGNSSSIGLTMPWDQAVIGDRVIAFVNSLGASTITGPGAGWAQLGATYRPAANMSSAIFYRDYTSLLPATGYTWTANASSLMTLTFSTFGGCDLTLPPLVNNNSTLVSSRTVTTTAQTMADGDYLYACVCGRQSPGDALAINWTPGSVSYFEWYDMRSPGTGTNPQLTMTQLDSGGPTPAGALTLSTTATKNLVEAHAWSVRLRVATPPPSTWLLGMPLR